MITSDISLAALIPYARNPRHNENAVDKVAASIKEFGFRQPIVVDTENVIIAGHTRYLAAQKLGIDTVPVHVAEGLTDQQVKAYRIADNRVSQEAEWDYDMLKLELPEIGELFTGFDQDEIDLLLAPEPTEGLTDEDAVPEIPEKPITVEGDIWILGNHRLMCGDSTSIDAVENLMDGQKANICFTSPPYNAGSMNVKGNKSTDNKYGTFDDNQTDDQFFDFLTSNLDCMFTVSDEIFYNIGLVQNNKKTIFQTVNHYGDKFKDVIYWKKKTAAPHIQKGIINNLVEFILCFGDGKRKFLNPQFSQGTYWNVIEGGNASGNEFASIHKATFPVYLPENIINNFTGRNAIVIDCFGGTGTTVIACEKTNRNCRMMELDPKYCDVIVKRWQDFTGKTAILENDDTRKVA